MYITGSGITSTTVTLSNVTANSNKAYGMWDVPLLVCRERRGGGMAWPGNSLDVVCG
jgi:hypothetical protein